MNEFYTQLLNGGGNRKVTLISSDVATTNKKGNHSTVISTNYSFMGNTNVTKVTSNLLERTSKTIKLTNINIMRTTDIKNVSIDIRFTSDANVILYTESDKTLVAMSDTEILQRLGITIS